MNAFTVLDPDRGTRVLHIPVPVSGAGTPGAASGVLSAVGLSNLAGTSDPGATTDATLGYDVGSLYFNGSAGALRAWICRDATAGAAKWSFVGADYANGGTNPPGAIGAFGGGVGLLVAQGTLNHQVSATGVNPGATAADNVLAAFSIPAGSFDAAGRAIEARAFGACAANTATKTMKIIFNPTTAVVGSTVGSGGTTLASTGAITTSGAAWALGIRVSKYGAAASNTQLGVNTLNLNGSADAALIAPALITAVESGAILVAVTGNAATTATDVALNEFEVVGKN